jgi:hypothetical protein
MVVKTDERIIEQIEEIVKKGKEVPTAVSKLLEDFFDTLLSEVMSS